jgi:hypothetical protein
MATAITALSSYMAFLGSMCGGTRPSGRRSKEPAIIGIDSISFFVHVSKFFLR